MKLLRLLIAATLVFQVSIVSGQLKSGTQPLPLVPPKQRALLIGVSNYKSLGVLDYAADDAAKMTNLLIEKFRFTRDTIRFLSDKNPDQGAKPDGPVTAASIRQELKSLLAEPGLNKSDLFLLYFSGHGVGTAKGDFLCPADATIATVESSGVPVQEVVESFVKAGLKNVLIIADACRSGQSNKFGDNLIDLGKKANLGILLGCAPGQRSYEYPDLGGGAFTYFLAKSLKDESIRTPYGVLWASKIAENVAQKVKAYTAKDYGDAAQVPTAWADGATDILVGAYPPKTWDATNLAQFKSEAKNLDRDRYQSATLELANNLALDHKYADTIDLLKALDGIGAASDESNFLLACTLVLTGRFGESDRMFLRVINGAEAPILRHRATALCQSRTISPIQKLKAAQNLWKLDKDESSALIFWSVARLTASAEDLMPILNQIIDGTPRTFRTHWMCMGDRDLRLNKPQLAITEYAEALKHPDEDGMLDDSKVRMAIYPILTVHGSADQRQQLIADALKDPGSRSNWLALQAVELKKNGDYAKALSTAMEASNGDSLDSAGMENCIVATGYECKLLCDNFERIAKVHPYDWRANLALGIVHSIRDGGKKGAENELSNLDRYSDDILTVLNETYPILETILQDAVTRLGVSKDKLDEFLLSSYKELLSLTPQFGADQNVWWTFASYGAATEYSNQALSHFKKYGLPLAEQGNLGSNGVTSGYLLAASMGDYVLAERLRLNPALLEPDRTLLTLNWATILLIQGRNAEVEQILDRLPEPIGDNQSLAAPLRAYLEAMKGDTADLLKIDFEKNDLAKPIAALAWAKLGNWSRAEPLLQASVDGLHWMFLPIQYRCIEVFMDRLRVQGKTVLAEEIAHNATFSYPGSNALNGIHFGTKPALNDYIGERTLTFNWASDLPYDPKNPAYAFEIEGLGGGRGTMTIKVGSTGETKLVLSKQNLPTITFTGTVDSNGNLRAIGPLGVGLTAKLIPTRLFANPDYLKAGQYLTVLTVEGRMERLYAKPAQALKRGIPKSGAPTPVPNGKKKVGKV